MLPLSCFICGTGLVLIPYTQAEYATVQLVIVAIIVAIGSGLFQPSSSTLLTTFAKHEGINLGIVMGAQESVSSFARILGPLTGGVVWTFHSFKRLALRLPHGIPHLWILNAVFCYIIVENQNFPDSSNQES